MRYENKNEISTIEKRDVSVDSEVQKSSLHKSQTLATLKKQLSKVKIIDTEEEDASKEYTLDNPTETSILNIDLKKKTIFDRDSSQPGLIRD